MPGVLCTVNRILDGGGHVGGDSSVLRAALRTLGTPQCEVLIGDRVLEAIVVQQAGHVEQLGVDRREIQRSKGTAEEPRTVAVATDRRALRAAGLLRRPRER